MEFFLTLNDSELPLHAISRKILSFEANCTKVTATKTQTIRSKTVVPGILFLAK